MMRKRPLAIILIGAVILWSLTWFDFDTETPTAMQILAEIPKNPELDLKCQTALLESVRSSKPPSFTTSDGVFVDPADILNQFSQGQISEPVTVLSADLEAIRAAIPILNSLVDDVNPTCVQRLYGDLIRTHSVNIILRKVHETRFDEVQSDPE